MTIHFQFTRDDVLRLHGEQHHYVQQRFSDPTPYRVCWSLLTPVAIATTAVVSGSFLVGALACGLFWGAFEIGNRWHRARFIRNSYTDENLATSLLPFQLELLPDRLILSNANLVHHHFWPSFRFLSETPGYFHLFFSPVSSMDIPKSAFHSSTDLEAFRAIIKSHEPANARSNMRSFPKT